MGVYTEHTFIRIILLFLFFGFFLFSKFSVKKKLLSVQYVIIIIDGCYNSIIVSSWFIVIYILIYLFLCLLCSNSNIEYCIDLLHYVFYD